MRTIPVKGYEGRYLVNEVGEIINELTGQPLRPTRRKNGYLRVCLGLPGGGRKDHLVHRIVCIAFNGEPPPGRDCVNHINCDKTDNRPENLEWCSYAENMDHASRQGLLFRQSKHISKVNEGRRVAIEAIDDDGNVVATFASIEIARLAGYTAVSHCLAKGPDAKSAGYRWRRRIRDGRGKEHEGEP